MKPKQHDTDFWSKRLDRQQLLKMLALAGSVMALKGPRGLAEATGHRSPRHEIAQRQRRADQARPRTVEEALRHVLSLPVASLVSGIDSRQVLQ